MNFKKLLIVLAMLVLFIGLTTISATDIEGTITHENIGVKNEVPTNEVQEITTPIKKENKKLKTETDTKSVKTESTSTKDTEKINTISNTTSNDKIKANTIKTTKTATQSSSNTQYNITNNNYNQFFNNDGSMTTSINDGDTINVAENINNKNFSLSKRVTFTSNDNDIVLSNSRIKVLNGADFSVIKNLNLTFNDGSSHAILVENVSNVTIKNNYVTMNYTEVNQTARGIWLNSAVNTTVKDNNVVITSAVKDIHYENDTYFNYQGVVTTCGIGVIISDNAMVSDNNITVLNSVHNNDTYATLTGIAVQGSILVNNETSGKNITNTNIRKNNINIKNDDKYAYGITLQYNAYHNTVEHNVIKTISNNAEQVNGIQLSDKISHNRVTNNKMYINSTNYVYGIDILGSAEFYVENNTIENNIIESNSSKTRGIELFFVNSSYIQYNTITLTGEYANGIGAGALVNSYIAANEIITNGTIATEYVGGYDNIKFITSGIYITGAQYWTQENVTFNSTHNILTENNIKTNGVYAINLTGNYNNIYFNYITSTYTTPPKDGNNVIMVSGEGNQVGFNDKYRPYPSVSGINLFNMGFKNIIFNSNFFFIEDLNSINVTNKQYSNVKSLKKEDSPKTHIINQDNYKNYFNATGLTDEVKNGDVLDIQDVILINEYLYIDKAVNVTSSTHKGMLASNVTPSETVGYEPPRGQRFTITGNGSHSNITYITFNNTEFFFRGAQYVTVDGINVTNIGVSLGTGTGVTSMRDGSGYINISNSYFHTRNNGGHSNVVLAGASYINFINNTIKGEGWVGNLFYITTYNTEVTNNSHARIINNTISKLDGRIAICFAMAISGNNNLVEGNYVNYPGDGIGQQVGGTASYQNNTFINNTVVDGGLACANATFINNTVNGLTTRGSNAYSVIGNIVNTLNIGSGINLVEGPTIVANNTINETVSIWQENTFFENNTIKNGTLNLLSNNNIIQNNTINGSVELNKHSNNTIKNNYVKSEKEYAVNLNGSVNNTVEYNELYSTINEGNDAVLSHENNTVINNYPGSYDYYIHSIDELNEVLEYIKTNGTIPSGLEGYRINFMEGNYVVTTPIKWGEASSSARKLIFNGNNQVVDGQNTSAFISIDEDYELIINNLTIQNMINSNQAIIANNGTLKINNTYFKENKYYNGIIWTGSTIDNNNVLILENSTFSSSYMVNRPNVVLYNSKIAHIKNNLFENYTFYSLSSLITNVGDLNFTGNEINNLSGTRSGCVLLGEGKNSNITKNYIHNFTGVLFFVNYAANTTTSFINNTCINITTPSRAMNIVEYNEADNEEYYTKVDIYDNVFINCSLKTKFESIDDETISSENYNSIIKILVSYIKLNTTVHEGNIIVYINGVEYETFSVVNGTSNITIDNSVLYKDSNDILLKYQSLDNSYIESTISFKINTNVSETIGTIFDLNISDDNSVGYPVYINATLMNVKNYTLVNQNVILKIDNKEIPLITDNNGKISYSYTPIISGNNTITIIFNGNERYNASEITKTTYVKRMNTTTEFTVMPIEPEFNTEYNIIVSVLDSFDNKITSGNIELYINNVLNETVTLTSDSYTFTKIIDDSTHNIFIKYVETDVYFSSNATQTIIAGTINTMTNTTDVLTEVIRNIELTAKVTTDDRIVNEGIVKFYLNGDYIGESVVKEGLATINTIINTTGKYNLTTKYIGNKLFNPSECTSTIEVIIINTTTTINATASNNNIYVVTKVVDTLNNPVTVGKIEYYANGVFIGEQTVTQTGINNYNFIISSFGLNKITAKYIQNQHYYESEASTDVLIEKGIITLTIEDIPTTKVNNDFTITTKLNYVGNPINEGIVEFYVNNKRIGQTTVSNGLATFTTSMDNAGTYTITANFMGTSVYNSESKTTSVTIEKTNTTTSVNTIVTGDTITINTKTMDSRGNLLTSGMIEYYVNGEKVTEVLINNGVTKHTLMNMMPNTYLITVKFKETNEYTISESSTVVSIAKKQVDLVIDEMSSVKVGDEFTVSSIVKSNGVLLTDGFVDFYVNNKKIGQAQVVNGYASFITKIDKVGTYIVTSKFVGTAMYDSVSESISVVVEKFNTVTSVNTIVTGDTITINTKTMDSRGNLLASGMIEYYVNGEKVSEQSVNADGTTSYAYMVDNDGSYQIITKYKESEMYSASEASKVVSIAKKQVNIIINNITSAKVNDIITITVDITSNENKVTQGTVKFYLNGVVIGISEVNDRTTIDTMVSESGINKIVVEYLENSNYNSELAQLVFNVDKINTTIKIDQINTTLYETAILKAYVEDIYGKTVNTGKVVFKVDDLVIGSANVEDGIAILTYMPTWNRILTKNVMVSYMENDKYCESSNETEINLIKTKATMLLTHNDNLKVGQKLIMTVSLGDNLINTGKIIFKIDGKTLKDEDGQMIFVKVTNGIAQFEYTIQSIFSARTHKITAVYAGTVLYERTETSSMLDIMKVNTHIELTPFIATMGENATLSAKILDEYNKPVQRNTTVVIKINGKTCINTVVENGILNITLPTETFKNEYYTLTIICGENSVYNGNTYTTFLLNKLASNNTKTIKTADISNNIKPVVYKTYSNNNENSSNISLTDNKPLLNNTKQRI